MLYFYMKSRLIPPNSFRFCSSTKFARNPFRICSSKTLDLKSFRISSYKNTYTYSPSPVSGLFSAPYVSSALKQTFPCGASFQPMTCFLPRRTANGQRLTSSPSAYVPYLSPKPCICHSYENHLEWGQTIPKTGISRRALFYHERFFTSGTLFCVLLVSLPKNEK